MRKHISLFGRYQLERHPRVDLSQQCQVAICNPADLVAPPVVRHAGERNLHLTLIPAVLVVHNQHITALEVTRFPMGRNGALPYLMRGKVERSR